MRGLMILANGFEDTEALVTRDVLSRAGIHVITGAINEDLLVTSQYNLEVKCDIYLGKINLYDFDFLIIPGGRAVGAVLSKKMITKTVIDHFYENNKLICAICAAPALLGELGYLKNKEYICFKGFENPKYGGKLSEDSVVVDGNIITARSMFYSTSFALAIVEKLLGNEKKEKVLVALKGE